MIVEITQDTLSELTNQAKVSPRLRMNLDLRSSEEDGSQRMLNAIEPGAVLPIHRHRNSSETVVCIRGRLIEEFYDGRTCACTGSYELSPSGPMIALNIPIGQWHTVRAMESGTVIMEVKDKKYEPLSPEDILELQLNRMDINENPYFQEALEFIQQNDLNALPNGRHVIDDDNLWVNIVDSELHTVNEAQFEAHDQYIDLQIPLSSPESYGVMSRRMCQAPIGTFNKDGDYILFRDVVTTVVTRRPGEMIVFTPSDAHAPLIGEGMIHKAIFKVKTYKSDK